MSSRHVGGNAGLNLNLPNNDMNILPLYPYLGQGLKVNPQPLDQRSTALLTEQSEAAPRGQQPRLTTPP